MKNLVSGRITVAVPTRNRATLVKRAVESALSQDYPDVEVVVSDNASTDDTVDLVEAIGDPRIRLLRQKENIGMIGNFNACLEGAAGEFFLMLSDDDVLEPGALARLGGAFQSPPEGLRPQDVGLVWCPCTITDDEDQARWISDKGPLVERSIALVSGFLDGSRGPRFCGVLVRTADALAVGRYVSEHGALCDVGNWMRVAVRYPYSVCIPDPLARYAMHQTSTTSASPGLEWQNAAEQVHSDLMEAVRDQKDAAGEALIRARKTAFITNMVSAVILHRVGGAGWVKYAFSELMRAPQYLMNRHVALRLLRDGKKLLRLSLGRTPRRNQLQVC